MAAPIRKSFLKVSFNEGIDCAETFLPTMQAAKNIIETDENEQSEHEIVNEIKDYHNAWYLSAIEAVWYIFKYKITLQLLSVIAY